MHEIDHKSPTFCQDIFFSIILLVSFSYAASSDNNTNPNYILKDLHNLSESILVNKKHFIYHGSIPTEMLDYNIQN